jgi:hypothetical protein
MHRAHGSSCRLGAAKTPATRTHGISRPRMSVRSSSAAGGGTVGMRYCMLGGAIAARRARSAGRGGRGARVAARRGARARLLRAGALRGPRRPDPAAPARGCCLAGSCAIVARGRGRGGERPPVLRAPGRDQGRNRGPLRSRAGAPPTPLCGLSGRPGGCQRPAGRAPRVVPLISRTWAPENPLCARPEPVVGRVECRGDGRGRGYDRRGCRRRPWDGIARRPVPPPRWQGHPGA